MNLRVWEVQCGCVNCLPMPLSKEKTEKQSLIRSDMIVRNTDRRGLIPLSKREPPLLPFVSLSMEDSEGKKMHYYQHHIGDFIKATSRLSDCQTMAYLRLLWMYYDSEKPLKPDIKILAFQIGASHEDTELLLKSYFVLCENGWHQKRCDKEIEEYRELLNKKSNAGKASAEQRKNRRSTDVEQVFNSSGTVEQLTNNHEPITNNHSIEEPQTKQRTKGSRLSADFDLPDSWTEFCQTERPDLNPQKVFDSFKDYWVAKAGNQGVKLDWQATWRNWVRNQNVAKPMFNKADVVHQTVPSSSFRDPALVKLDEDRMRSAPPNPEVLARIRAVLGKTA